MAQGYYNLEEAARVLGMSPDELRGMAQRNQIRSFQDRGTLRFRIQDIQEMARRRGATSDPDLVIGQPSGPKTPMAPPRNEPAKSDGPKSGGRKSALHPPPKSPKPAKQAPAAGGDVFQFSLEGDDSTDIGREVLSESGSKAGSRSGRNLKAGSDSDVRLVTDSAGPKTPKVPPQRKSQLGPASPGPKRTSRLAGGAPPLDSGVRLVPMDSDSDVKIVGAGSAADEISLGAPAPPSATDSDIRLERIPDSPKSDEAMLLTDEIDLDEEIKKQEQTQKRQPKSRVRPKSELRFPSQSPFELSDSDINQPTEASDEHPSSSDFELSPAAHSDSSDFDLSPPKEESAVLETDSGDDFSLELPDDSIDLAGSGEAELTGPTSGINLSNPADDGISLEESASDDVDLDLSLEAEETPKPAPREDASDSSSEFELSLEGDDSGQGAAQGNVDSDSEFELTLDDSGSADLADDGPQAKAGAGDRDIFETDFEVPALEDESGSQVAALDTADTDLESSDFDLALDDSDLAVEDESGSQVVALDEEAADEAAETLAGEISEDIGVDDGEEVDEDDERGATGPVREIVREKLIEPAPWGALPVIFMLPCVIVMLMIGIMGFELVQSSAGFKSTGTLTKAIGELIGQKLR